MCGGRVGDTQPSLAVRALTKQRLVRVPRRRQRLQPIDETRRVETARAGTTLACHLGHGLLVQERVAYAAIDRHVVIARSVALAGQRDLQNSLQIVAR